MMAGPQQKVTAGYLKRNAYLYIRQSTIRQVFENTESTKRQYALRERAVALGWPLDRIVVIDSDLGPSGASAADREGFQELGTEVSMGAPASCSGWRFRGWRETPPTGTVFWKSVR
jgi:DNA invertase Pin-like site-specific DNA recombinase